MNLDDNYKSAFTIIEKTEEFKRIDRNISGVFYTLYSRNKRLFYAMTIIKDCKDKNVNTTEILPLLRVFLEGLFHISYITTEKDTDFIRKGYEHLSYWSGKRIAKKLSHSQHIGEEGQQFISKFDLSYKLPSEYKFLDDMASLSEKTGKKEIYRKHYTPLNSFIHFNPATFINYGMFDGNAFVYNVENELERESVLNTMNMSVYLFIAEIVTYLGSESLDEEITELLKENLEKLVG